MASGSDSHERARADRMADEYGHNEREREVANARIEIRAEMLSSGEEEDTNVINLRVAEAQKLGRLPQVESLPPSKATVWSVTHTAVKRMPPMGLAIVVGILGLAVVVAYTLLKLRGVALPQH